MILLLRNPPLAWRDILSKEHWHLWMFAASGILWAAAEIIALIRGRRDATFTYIVKKGVPRWLLAAIFGWLAYHFFIES